MLDIPNMASAAAAAVPEETRCRLNYAVNSFFLSTKVGKCILQFEWTAAKIFGSVDDQ
jgi:hypothetical protein